MAAGIRNAALGLILAMGAFVGAQAAMVMPDYANVPVSWSTDRYDPHSFSNVGAYQGKGNVLGIEIDRAEGASARPAAFSAQFYNTQGRQHALVGAGAGSVLAASLYIESSWLNAANGNVRSDMWGVVSDAAPAVTDYPIIGFTNYGGAPRYRVWDADVGGWVDLAAVVTPGGWVDFAMELTATSVIYSINGSTVYTDSTIGGDHFSAVIMQAYNFFDASIAGAVPENYIAHWANLDAAQVAEPATLALLLIGAAVAGRRRERHNA